MILLALAKTERIRGHSSKNTQCTAIFFSFATYRQLPYFPEAKLSSIFLPSIFWKYSKTFHQQPENFQRLFISNPKKFKEFFACKFVLAANHQYPGNIQRLSSQQQQQPAAATRKSNQQKQSEAATSKSNQQQRPAAATSKSNQQQQPAAATSKSNQKKQSTEAIRSSNQQKQSTAATSSSNQQKQSTAATSSSNQQKQSTAATRSSNQQKQSTAAISSSNQQRQPAATTSNSNKHSSYQQHLHNQRRPPLVITTVPSRGYPANSSPRTSCPVAECNHRTAAHFCDFSTFLNSLF